MERASPVTCEHNLLDFPEMLCNKIIDSSLLEIQVLNYNTICWEKKTISHKLKMST